MEDLNGLYTDRKDDGFVVLNVLTQDLEYGTVEPDEAALWRDTIGLDFPVLAGEEEPFLAMYGNGHALDVFHLISPEGEVVWSWYSHPPETFDAITAAVDERL